MDSHSPLKRTPTNTSEGNFNDANPLPTVYSANSSITSAPRPSQRLAGRTPSTHSLLAANKNPEVRKGAHSGTTTKASVDRSSISMPPPSTKPLADRRLSASIQSALSMRKSEETARSPPASVKSLEGERSAPYNGSPTAYSATTAHDPTIVTTTASTSHAPGLPVLSPPPFNPSIPNQSDLVSNLSSQIASASPSAPRGESQLPLAPTSQSLGITGKAEGAETALPVRPPRVNKPRSLSSTRRLSTTGSSKNESINSEVKTPVGRIGVCALDVKARSRPSRQILTRLQGDGEFEVIVFGDKAILDEDVENWPMCDYLISFFSDGFPLDKAIAYVKLRKPFVVNDLSMQKVLWDRRLCLKILDKMQIPTPKRIEVNRDGGPKLESPELADLVKKMSGVVLEGPEDGTGGGAPMTKHVELVDDGDTLVVEGQPIRKPFVEKPVDGEDHNVIIYFPRSQDGGARRLFRKIGNKSSEFDPELTVPRCLTEPNSSYIYEQFLKTENAEDVKAYTVGPDYCHAETRKSPVVDGLVRRNTHGKELRYVTKLTPAEKEMASKVSRAFGQRICGFDLLRTGTASYIIDVNGWSFVKDNEDYYNDCAKILRHIFLQHKFKEENAVFEEPVSESNGDPTQRRQGTSSSARSAFKTILKSPSMTKLSQHLPHSSRLHPSALSGSSKTSAMTTPISSPPSMEKGSHAVIHPVGIDKGALPPPAVPAPEAVMAPEPVASAKETKSDPPLPSSKHSWKLKGVVTVIRHADRTPKQKLKLTAHSQVFADLLKGHHEEVLLKGEAALASVQTAVKIALRDKLEDPDKLRNLQNALSKKMNQPGTKVQIKPMFRKRKPEEMSNSKPLASPPIIAEEEIAPDQEAPPVERHASTSSNKEMRRVNTRSDSMSGATFSRFSAAENDLVLDKLQLVMKWGGEPTHSARYQSQDLGTNMRDDFKLLNKEVLDEVRIFTSSEKRVKTSAQIWAAAFLDRQDISEDFIQVRKDLLDDSNAAKDVMDKVKKKLKHLLREGTVPDSFAWPKNVAEPYVVMQSVIDLLKFHRRVMRHNFKKLSTGAVASLNALNGPADAKDNGSIIAVASIQSRWCTGEDAELFKERWEKLFSEFCDTEKADPSKISELYDTMKYDALHNKQFLEWAFTPSQSLLDEMAKEEEGLSSTTSPEPERTDDAPSPTHSPRHGSVVSPVGEGRHSLAHKIGLRRQSVLKQAPPTPPLTTWEQGASYFKLFPGSGDSRSKQDQKLGRLRELYRYSKILFDYIGPQEYGISDDEKLEIGLLTSLPLLREIVDDLEELQASGDAKSFVYFTKESHIYTLLNCIMEGGIHTKIKRSTIPELDYLSQICFELYEAKDVETAESTYSIRISISPGCHTVDPLDVSLDSKHAIGSAPRRSLTNHQDWKEVISTLKAKFNTVQLPKSFLAVNVSDKHEQEAEMQRRASYLQSEAAKQKYTNNSASGDLMEVNAEDSSGGPHAGDALVRDLENPHNTQPEPGTAMPTSSGQESTVVEPQFVSVEEKDDMNGDASLQGRGRSI